MSTKSDNEKLGMLFIIISAVLFGFMPLLAKVAYQHGGNACSVAFGIFFIGTILLLLIILVIPSCKMTVNRIQIIELAKLSFFYALMPILLYGSYEYIDSGLATTLHFTYPIVVVILLALFCKEKPDIKQLFCIATSIVGIACLYTPNGQTNIKGIIFAILSGVAYAVYIVLLGKSKINELHSLVVSFYISLFSAINIGVIGLVTNSIHMNGDGTALATEVILALLTTVIALVLFQRGVYLCGEIKASLLSSFEPLTGILVGIAVFHEVVSWKEVVGIIFILAAAMILVIPARKNTR